MVPALEDEGAGPKNAGLERCRMGEGVSVSFAWGAYRHKIPLALRSKPPKKNTI
jgi:hypothetical protein